MARFERCDSSVDELAKELLGKFETHKPLLAAKVKVDFVFAFCDRDEDTGDPLNDALTLNGVRALGICRKIGKKDRALGRGDAEIAIDGDYWADALAAEQAALLDHELHHLKVKMDKAGNVKFDDLGRPELKLRKHDVEIGWFKIIADRHGAASQERIHAKHIMEDGGQYFWPEFAAAQLTTGSKPSKAKVSKRGATEI